MASPPRSSPGSRTDGWKGADLINTVHRFQTARKDPSLAVLEGFHAIKHALRFGAIVTELVTRDLDHLRELCAALAPDIAGPLEEAVAVVPASTFNRLAPVAPDTGVIAIARRRSASAAALFTAARAAPLVLLERPTHLGNLGAAIRAAASAGAAGLVLTGRSDPWHPTAIRGAAGLQYAVPVARAEALGACRGPLWTLDPAGEPLHTGAVPADAILAFGSERRGLSPELLARADHRVAIPMEPGVSSLNLATAVAVVLYTWRLGR